ncbi:MAG TPA: hypothetical protein VFC19_45005 [Candidatus Limnocylindrales bacterium]|nr:hypothetical protein [Candidatus Limnocylindrales bacterium]
MNLTANLTALLRAVTYRNALTNPDPAALHITGRRLGGRTVHHPDIPAYLHHRRRRLLRQGLDPVDVALLDPETVALLRRLAARMNLQRARALRQSVAEVLAELPDTAVNDRDTPTLARSRR